MRWGALAVWGVVVVVVGVVSGVRAGGLRLTLGTTLEELLIKNVTIIDGAGGQKQPGMRTQEPMNS